MALDQYLVDKCIDYHGVAVVDELYEEQGSNIQLPSFLTLSQHAKSKETAQNESFQKAIVSFIAKKADVVFLKKEIKAVEDKDNQDEELYSELPPLESFMDVPGQFRREHVFECLNRDDIVVGTVFAVQESGLVLTLNSLDCGKTRDIDGLKITAFCPVRDVPKCFSHENPLEAFNIKDHVRGIILNVIPEAERIIVSLHNRSLPPGLEHIKVGLITKEEFPISYRKQQIIGATYLHHLHKSGVANNPHSVANITSLLGIEESQPQSLMRGLHNVRYHEDDYVEKLRSKQSHTWALKSVAQGIIRFKEGRHTEAVQFFNKALQMDKRNVEALVARGALYANNESYRKAIEDFEEALEENPHHSNAKNYLSETIMAQAKCYLDQDRKEDARHFFQRAINHDSLNDEARSAICQIDLDAIKEQKTTPRPPPATVEVGDHSDEDNSENMMQQKSLQRTTDLLKRLIQQDQDKTGKHNEQKKKPSKRRRDDRSSSSSGGSSSSSSNSSSSTDDNDRRHKHRNKQKSKKRQRKYSRSSRSSGVSRRTSAKQRSTGSLSPVSQTYAQKKPVVEKEHKNIMPAEVSVADSYQGHINYLNAPHQGPQQNLYPSAMQNEQQQKHNMTREYYLAQGKDRGYPGQNVQLPYMESQHRGMENYNMMQLPPGVNLINTVTSTRNKEYHGEPVRPSYNWQGMQTNEMISHQYYSQVPASMASQVPANMASQIPANMVSQVGLPTNMASHHAFGGTQEKQIYVSDDLTKARPVYNEFSKMSPDRSPHGASTHSERRFIKVDGNPAGVESFAERIHPQESNLTEKEILLHKLADSMSVSPREIKRLLSMSPGKTQPHDRKSSRVDEQLEANGEQAFIKIVDRRPDGKNTKRVQKHPSSSPESSRRRSYSPVEKPKSRYKHDSHSVEHEKRVVTTDRQYSQGSGSGRTRLQKSDKHSRKSRSSSSQDNSPVRSSRYDDRDRSKVDKRYHRSTSRERSRNKRSRSRDREQSPIERRLSKDGRTLKVYRTDSGEKLQFKSRDSTPVRNDNLYHHHYADTRSKEYPRDSKGALRSDHRQQHSGTPEVVEEVPLAVCEVKKGMFVQSKWDSDEGDKLEKRVINVVTKTKKGDRKYSTHDSKRSSLEDSISNKDKPIEDSKRKSSDQTSSKPDKIKIEEPKPDAKQDAGKSSDKIDKDVRKKSRWDTDEKPKEKKQSESKTNFVKSKWDTSGSEEEKTSKKKKSKKKDDKEEHKSKHKKKKKKGDKDESEGGLNETLEDMEQFLKMLKTKKKK